jgi:hypothetical protein
MWTEWLRIGTRLGSCEHGIEPLGSMKGGEFLDYLSRYCYPLKKGSAPYSLLVNVVTGLKLLNTCNLNFGLE